MQEEPGLVGLVLPCYSYLSCFLCRGIGSDLLQFALPSPGAGFLRFLCFSSFPLSLPLATFLLCRKGGLRVMEGRLTRGGRTWQRQKSL